MRFEFCKSITSCLMALFLTGCGISGHMGSSSTTSDASSLSKRLFYSSNSLCISNPKELSESSLQVERLHEKVRSIFQYSSVAVAPAPTLFSVPMTYQNQLFLSDARISERYLSLARVASLFDYRIYDFLYGKSQSRYEINALLMQPSEKSLAFRSYLYTVELLWELELRWRAVKCQVLNLAAVEKKYTDFNPDDPKQLAPYFSLAETLVPMSCETSSKGVKVISIPVDEGSLVSKNIWIDSFNVWSSSTVQLVPNFKSSGDRIIVKVAITDKPTIKNKSKEMFLFPFELENSKVIAHELGHLLGYSDCYIMYFSTAKRHIVYYELEPKNIMCSIQAGTASEFSLLNLAKKACK